MPGEYTYLKNINKTRDGYFGQEDQLGKPVVPALDNRKIKVDLYPKGIFEEELNNPRGGYRVDPQEVNKERGS